MKLQPALVFGEHMVLQRDKEIKVWGYTAIDDVVTVSLGGEVVKAPAPDGKWMAVFSPKEATSQTTMTIESRETEEFIEFRDVAIGEVWLAGGQSNMEFLMKFDYDFEDTKKLPDDKDLRYFCYPETAYKGFMETEDYLPNWGFWRKWTKEENRKQFSAVAGYMGMILRKKLGVPVGILACNWGGTPASAWTAPEDLAADPVFKPILDWHSEALKNINWERYIGASDRKAPPKDPEVEAIFEKMMMGEDVSEFFKNFNPEDMLKGDFVPFMPGPRSTVRPSGLYENMLCKVAPYTIRGAVWYQGEDDDARDWQDFYDVSMKTLIKSWRKLWGYSFPFYQVDLAPFRGWGPTGAKKYPLIRHQQSKSSNETEDAYDICILDAGEEFNIHPRHKKIVGERLGRVVMKHTYGDNTLVADCPKWIRVDKRDGKVDIYFDNAADGMEIRGDLKSALKIKKGDTELEYTATVDNDRVTLETSFSNEDKLHIEYCEENYCPAVLFNSEGNPAYAFTVEL